MSHIMAQKIKVCGVIQGVGFRPFVHRLAERHGLRGWVRNEGSHVEIWVEGTNEQIQAFVRGLHEKHPPAAQIKETYTEVYPVRGYSDFVIQESKEASGDIFISPDLALCPECLQEFRSHRDRRFRYPFINCTNCGPRYTIIRQVPYDRGNTTMAEFTMCQECSEEYHDIKSRRYHAQPNACPQCGPTLSLVDAKGCICREDFSHLLAKGFILAVKGLGGFHLVCDARNPEAVNTLRQRKGREAKPFALMAKDLDVIKKYAYISKEEEELLQSPQAPIVLLEQILPSSLPPSLNPGLKTLGMMLPYTPLHHLLFTGNLDILVMTSANLSHEPIVYTNEEALQRLKSIADYFLLHNRPIYHRCDDSITAVVKKHTQISRRARGYVPLPVKITPLKRRVLALGGDLKNTFCLAAGDKAFLSQHMGDMDNLEAQLEFRKTLSHLQSYFNIAPEIVAHDLHPGYTTTQLAQSLNLPLVGVQHHEAHLASCLVDNNYTGEVLGLVCDGTGYGSDSNLWGFEFFRGTIDCFQRLAHLAYVPLIGGDKTVERPDRMALLFLLHEWGQEGAKWAEKLLGFAPSEIALYQRILQNSRDIPLTSSCGRLFDAVSALTGVCRRNSYEGQAAMELESLCIPGVKETYSFAVRQEGGIETLSLREMWPELIADICKKRDTGFIAAKFHRTLQEMITHTFLLLREETNITTVALSGGVMQNKVLLSGLLTELERKDFEILIHRQVPPNDGGISLGQAVIAGR
ncbi:carbamoyltransferase HypF [Thermanaerosceptrum fracticalcis]|nr:carbamoyltransferase HypF [Thermanaerosceptrum fracticalcis]